MKFSDKHETKCVLLLLILTTVYLHRVSTVHKKEHKLNKVGNLPIKVTLRRVRLTIFAVEKL